ncbi:uncharacterized protein LOC124807639 isoform X1 [Hydra vulgaris]|uniref:uncharacterized protein LOC124807639 isoform X1 n=1 Tax=Hydra vulgaris TaxID=6087 RepID=UPI001F5FA9AD|nr:uncharacterized protein LOC124807639 isoform X1 [Hydra vulgaris]
MQSEASPPSKRLLTSQASKDTGVKKQLLVAVTEGGQENYNNVKVILSLLDIQEVNFVISCDMKLANILCGLQAHSSSHPCTWCTAESSNLVNCGTLRTFGSLKQSFHAFSAAGSNTKNAKKFRNLVHESVLSLEDSALVIDLIPPMELHLLLGVVNHLFKILKNLWPKADEWLQALHIKYQPFHGGQFEGNSCNKLLKNLDLLQILAEKYNAFQVFPIIETFRKFENVVSCFGNKLHSQFEEKIDEFRASFFALPIGTVTPKTHAVFFHIKEFILRKKMPLGIYSEQTTEAMHHCFSTNWARYKHPISHPEYEKRVVMCLVDFNSKNL